MKPTSASLRLTADAKDAFEAGNKIQFHSLEYPHHPWKDCDHPVWELFYSEYRPTPARKFRPWTTEEVPLGCHITNGIGRWVIGTVYDNKVFLDGCGWLDTHTLFARFTQLANGQPCGTEEA